ncbi:MAG: hypothetical protein QW054_00280 [Candidatus Micrarchaeia archaeon]
MQNIFTKKDVLNLVIILLYTYFLLGLVSNPGVLTYERASSLNMGKEKMIEVSNLSLFIGIVFAFIVYIISRVVFKQSELPVFVSSLLMVSSYAFINNFSVGISDLTFLLMGGFSTPSFGFEKIYQILPLLPLSLLSIYVLYSDKKMKYVFTGITALIASFFMPLIALPVLFILNADGFSRINKIKDRGILSTIAGGAIAAVISLIILGSGVGAIGLSILIGLVIAVVMLAFENKHTLLYLLTVTLIMISIEYAIASMLNKQTVDLDTVNILSLINDMDGRIAFASVYGNNISKISTVETGKNVLTNEAFLFLFTNRTPSFDYLIIDTFILDYPKEYAKLVNATVTFETFAFAGIQRQGDTYYQTYLTYKHDYLLIPTDSAGNILSNRIIINGAEDSYFKLLILNSSDSSYFRYIHPMSDSNKNIFKVLYPNQFGSLSGYEIKEIKSSNNSRFRIYQIIKQ